MKKQISLDKLGEIVYKKRLEQDLSQEALGEKTDINRQMISRIEGKKYLPSLPQLNKILEVLDIEFNDLLEDKSNGDIFLAMKGEAQTEAEKNGFEKMITMMLCYRKHQRIRGIINE
ncbi:helix-turn-helix transcriptional regulator [Priestia koreensis]|uniref:helix-turn-helix transcriptional regulator n=1 Tax=Priestia koreensis TaxID=284581 RepID=UPI003D088021